MWKKKKKENLQIKVHKLEIEKLKLSDQVKQQKTEGLVCCVVLLMMLIVLWMFLVN